MNELLLFAALGLGAGAAYAMIGSGIALVYRGSGVVNFAQGALAMAGALEYLNLVDKGLSQPFALIVTLVMAALLGLAIQYVVMAPLRTAPALARLVATLGLALLLQAIETLRFGSANNTVTSILPTDPIAVFGVSFGRDRLYLAVIAIAISVVLSLAVNHTRAGSLLRAASDSEKGVALLGYSPDALAGATWLIGTVLAALGGILIVSITGADQTALTLLVIPALAAALLGRFSKFWLVALTGLGIGVAQSVLTGYQGQYGIPLGSRDVLPFVVIIVAIVVRGRLIPDRSILRAGLGALFASKLGTDVGLPFLIVVPLAALLVVPCGIVIGLPALRVRGINLAIVTLGGAVAVDQAVFRNADLTGGLDGSRLPSASVLGLNVGALENPFRFGIVVLVILVGCLLAGSWLRRSPIGLRMLAVRDNERAAAAEGVSLARTKLQAFSLSAFLAGLGGALYGYQQQVVSFDRFSPFASILLIATVYLGGIGAMSGAALAGIVGAGGIVVVLFANVDKIDQYQNLLAGIGVLAVAIHRPDGMMPVMMKRIGARFRRKPADVTAEGVVPLTDVAHEPDEKHHRLEIGDPVLVTSDLRVTYGSVVALDDVSIEVRRGEVVGLIGPNGAGKSTFIDAVTGFTHCTGTISFAERDLSRMAAHRRARMGLRRTFQSLELFEDLTIEENLVLGQRRDVGNAVELAPAGALDLVGLPDVRRRLPTELSNGDRKLVGVARALVGRPDFVLLDEPAAGLNSDESQELGRRLQRVAARGISVLLIDHDLDLVLEHTDRVYVMDRGRLIAHASPGEIRHDETVRAAYIGDVPDEAAVIADAPAGAS